MLVKKKTGELRFCIDYRKLNEATKKDVCPLPRIDECFDAMSEARWFSTFDLRSGYHQVLLDAASSDKTTISREGTFRFKVMPFGLCTAPVTFPTIHGSSDVGIETRDMSGLSRRHHRFLKGVTGPSAKAEEDLRASTCSEVEVESHEAQSTPATSRLPGHVVSEAGIATDSEKIKSVETWPIPTSLKEVRPFLGLCSYYPRFLKGLSEKASSLHRLAGKHVPFIWTPKCQQVFEELRLAFTTTPVLAMPTDEDTYILDTDASHHTIGAVLSQVQAREERLIAYANRTYSKARVKYCTTRQELLAVVHFIKQFKQYLLVRDFVIRTDHAALTWLQRTPDIIGQQARWQERLQEFNFKIQPRPGTRHGTVDALSRRP